MLARAAIVVLLTAGPLLPTLRAAFVYDDTTLIRDNVLLRGWSALRHVWSLPYWPSDGVDVLGLYRPLHLALISVVWNAGGGSPRWLHAYALLLAALTAVAVWSMLRRGVAEGAALVAAIWFASHPLHVEAIASVANTSELLVVLCIVALVKVLGETPPTPEHRARDWARAALVGALCAAALLAKESGLFALPLAALTVWGWQHRGDSAPPLRRFVRDNLRAWLAALVGIAAVLFARSVVLGVPIVRASIAAQGLDTLSTPERVRVMLSLWPHIAGMLAWPTSLSPYYGTSLFPTNAGALALLSVTVVLALVTLAIVAARRGERRPLVAAGWVALTYFPASNLVAATGQILSDRTLFGATVGAALAMAWGIDHLPPFLRRVAMVLVAIVIARSVLVTTSYAVAWTSHRTLWTRLAEAAPTEHLSYKLLGMDARARGDTSGALALLGHAFAMQPADRQTRFEFGQVLYTTGRYASAVQVLQSLMKDGDARAEEGLVSLYLDAVGRARGPHAVVTAATSLLRSESAPVAALFLGVALEQLGQPDAADSAYATGLRRRPEDARLVARRTALHSARAGPRE